MKNTTANYTAARTRLAQLTDRAAYAYATHHRDPAEDWGDFDDLFEEYNDAHANDPEVLAAWSSFKLAERELLAAGGKINLNLNLRQS